jgi:hypothetical protein
MNRPRTAGCVPARTIPAEKGACLHPLPNPAFRALQPSTTGIGKAPLFPLLDLARAKSGHCPDGRACPPGGRRVRARPVRRGRISQASGVLMAPCQRACALWQRPGGPSTGRSADRAGAMKQALCWFDGVHPAAAPWPAPEQRSPRKPQMPPGPAPGRHSSSSLDLARAKSGHCPDGRACLPALRALATARRTFHWKVRRAGAMNQPLRWLDGVHPAAAPWPEPRQGSPRKPQMPPGPAPGRHSSSSLDLARAKSGHCPDGRACPSGGRRVRARPVRRGRISQASGVPMAPCQRACALWQRPGGPSTGRSADRAGAMKQALLR